MKVKELIEKLKEMPQDMEVLTYEYTDIYDVYVDNAYDDEEKFVIIN